MDIFEEMTSDAAKMLIFLFWTTIAFVIITTESSGLSPIEGLGEAELRKG